MSVRFAHLATVALAAVLVSCGGGSSDSPTAPGGAGAASRVIVTPATDTLRSISATTQLSANVQAATGATLGMPVTWSSSNLAVATVTPSGTVTAIAAGNARITAAAGGVQGTASIAVRPAPASVVVVSGDRQSGAAGEALPTPLVVEVRDAGGSPVALTALAWTVGAGSGSVSSASATTDEQGRGQATWQLGAVGGSQSVTVHVAGISPATFTATSDGPTVGTVVLTPAVDTLTSIGATVQYTVLVSDESGTPIPGATAAFTSSDPAVATITASGLATAVAQGTTSVVARVGSKEDTAALVVAVPPAQAVSVSSVEPAVLIEGQSATIRGAGFGATPASNVVRIDGLTAAVTAAASTVLTITVPASACKPSRQAQLSVSTAGSADSMAVSVAPASDADLDLAVGAYRVSAGSGCLHLPGSATAGEYLIGIGSVSPVPSAVNALELSAIAGEAGINALNAGARLTTSRDVADALRAPNAGTSTAALSPSLLPGYVSVQGQPDIGDGAMMAANRRLRAQLGPALQTSARGATGARAHAAGDTVTLNADLARTCLTSGRVKAVVRLVGNNVIWLDDVANPVATFTDAELSDLDAFYGSEVKPVHDAYFGAISDVDANNRIMVLMTREVNRAGLAGWVWFGDLYPPSQCDTSNNAELFFGFVPDPSGDEGKVWGRQEVLDFYPNLLTHEIAHLVQANAQVLGGAGSKTGWEVEGGASLAEQLVAYRVFGHGSRQNLGDLEYRAGRYWYWTAWVKDLTNFFGWDSSGDAEGRVADAPQMCTWIGNEGSGNDGPCTFDAVYGVPSMVLRFALDRFGPAYPGGEEALMRRLTASPQAGYPSLEEISGWSTAQILAEFYLTLWADGRVGDTAGMASWNLHDIVGRFSADHQLQPFQSADRTPSLQASVRGGSNIYLHWQPGESSTPTAIRVNTQGGVSVPVHIYLWALRVK